MKNLPKVALLFDTPYLSMISNNLISICLTDGITKVLENRKLCQQRRIFQTIYRKILVTLFLVIGVAGSVSVKKLFVTENIFY